MESEVPNLPPATLRLEYRLETTRQLTIIWTTPTASGRQSRPLTAQDNADMAGLARALSAPGSEWQPLSNRVANLLLAGIEPPGNIRRLVVSLPEAGPLRAIPFEALGTPPLVERFAVWYEPSLGPPRPPLVHLWPVPSDSAARFNTSFERETARGLEAAEALRRVKLELLRTGGPRAHPFHWAGFVLIGDGVRKATPLIPWLWLTGLGLLFASAAFLIWWRRKRFELL
jgi:CHAT domain